MKVKLSLNAANQVREDFRAHHPGMASQEVICHCHQAGPLCLDKRLKALVLAYYVHGEAVSIFSSAHDLNRLALSPEASISELGRPCRVQCD